MRIYRNSLRIPIVCIKLHNFSKMSWIWEKSMGLKNVHKFGNKIAGSVDSKKIMNLKKGHKFEKVHEIEKSVWMFNVSSRILKVQIF